MADESSVKMETLKKAYAEIILNTSKEAAARIMVADRRAMCFQKDLIALKDDALRMLLQLKQMLDFKAAEAEVKSESQQRKIDELEAQLSEAEGIIVDLREELRVTQDKYEEVKYSQRRPIKQKSSEDFEDSQPPLENGLAAKTDKYPPTENACGDQVFMSARALPSILSRASTEKTSTSFRPSMLSRASVQVSKEPCSSSSSEPDEQDAKLVKSQEFESHHAQSFRDGSRRNRKNLKYQEAIAALRRSSHGKNAKSCQLPSLSKCKNKTVKQKREIEGDTADKESDMVDCNSHEMQISDDEENAGISNRADSDKSLKFTFQRKRKRDMLTNLDNSTAPEGYNGTNEALLENEDAVKMQKSVVKDEQTNDGRQLLQLAQQLISMSGNGTS